RERKVLHAEDVLTDASELRRRLAQAGRYRTLVLVPMLRGGSAVGAIGVARSDPAGGAWPFTEKEISLLRTFADQAVIAVENVRLFHELEARNRELIDSLEQQTATSEILRAISASPTDTQPVFDTIAQRAVRVCEGTLSTVYGFDGTLIHLVSHYGLSTALLEEVRWMYPAPVTVDTVPARSIRAGMVVHVPDYR